MSLNFSRVILSEDAPPHLRARLWRAGWRRASESKNLFSRFAILIALFALTLAPLRAADDTVRVQLNADNAGPHEMQDTTRDSIAKGYARAWESMARALSANNPGLLDAGFLGTARDNLAQRIAGQRRNGLTTRIVDRGHKVDVLFYSPEGMSMQLRDTAQVEFQLLDGDKVVHTDTATRHYIVVMTPTEVAWKVRVMQEQP